MDGAILLSGSKAIRTIHETCRVARRKIILAVSNRAHDGNKRAAFWSIGSFSAINGHRLKADPADAVLTMLALARGNMAGGFAKWITEYAARESA